MKSIKRLFAVLMIAALMVSCFAINISAETVDTNKYYFVRLNTISRSNPNYDYSNDDYFLTLEFLKEAGVLVRTGNPASKEDFSYAYNGTTICTFKNLNDNGKYLRYPNPDATDKQDIVYKISQDDIDRDYSTTLINGKTAAITTYNYIMVYASTNPVIDVSEEYAKAYIDDVAINIPLVLFSNPAESALSADEIYNKFKLLSVGMYIIMDEKYLGMGGTQEETYITTEDGKTLFYMESVGASIDLILQSGITYEDNVDWANDKTIDERQQTLTAGTATYFKTIKFIHGKEYTSDDASWTKGSSDGQSVKSNAAKADFKFVMVDGNIVDSANFDVTEGSTIITFKPAYLATLSVGDHPVIIGSKNGVAETVLTIKEAPTPTPTPKEETKEETTTEKAAEKAAETAPAAEPEAVADTADTNSIAVFAALTALSAAGFVTVKKKEN